MEWTMHYQLPKFSMKIYEDVNIYPVLSYYSLLFLVIIPIFYGH